jgi:hypothetical protein
MILVVLDYIWKRVIGILNSLLMICLHHLLQEGVLRLWRGTSAALAIAVPTVRALVMT